MGQYDLIRVVGEGASAVSYLAQDKSGRKVLVKRFKTAFYKEENDFKREVEVLCGLVHPQIPQYIDSYIEKIDGRSLPHIVQEFIHGESLESYLNENRPSEEEILDWIGQLLGVLSYLHALRPPVVHRDIKSSNILLRDGQVVLIDFGLAVNAQNRTMGHTLAVGTLGYQAPEQISGNPTIRSDLYSVGALAIELFTGRSPSTMLDGMRLRWQEKCMDLPTNLQRWLDKMLAMEERARFQDAAEAIRGLPQLEKKVKVIQSAIRKPIDVDVCDDFMSMLTKKKEEKKQEDEAERRMKLEAEEAKRRFEEEREQARIEAKRAKRDAEQHKQEMIQWIQNEEARLIAEMEAAWEAGVPEVVGQRLDPEDLIAAMKHSFGNRSPIEREGIVYDVVHPLYLLCTMYIRDIENVATLAYRKWVVDNKSSQYDNDPKIDALHEQLRMKKQEVAEKDKQLEELGWFWGLFQKAELEQQRAVLLVQQDEIEVKLAAERKEFVQSCLDVYWRPWFGSAVERWIHHEFQDVDRKIEAYKEPLRIKRELQRLNKDNTSFLQEQKKVWRQKGKDVPATCTMVAIPAGTCTIGALSNDNAAEDDEKQRHDVTFTKGFWIGAYPCTQELYEAVMGENPSSFLDPKKPVENVSWCDAVRFCNRLSELESLEPVYILPQPFQNTPEWSKMVKWNKDANGYRLPTESEWEYCARGGDDYLYSGSSYINEVAWYDGNSGKKTHLVGQKKCNGFGLYDMSGNVWEWVWDSWQREYKSSVVDPEFTDHNGTRRGTRGGSWYGSAKYSRVSDRYWHVASRRFSFSGFRFVRRL